MNHASAREAIESLFVGRPPSRGALRAHLDGCAECRAHYDQTAKTFRAVSGKPDEMTAEELWLFEPVFPAAAPARFRVPVVVGTLLALAAAAVLVVWVGAAPDPEFSARGSGNPPAAGRPDVRALCTHAGPDGQVVVNERCAAGDTLAFVASGKGFVAIEVDGQVVTSATVDGPDTVLPQTVPWREDLKWTVVLSPQGHDRVPDRANDESAPEPRK